MSTRRLNLPAMPPVAPMLAKAEDVEDWAEQVCNTRVHALNNAAISALIAATTAGKALVDDDCAKKSVAELTRD